MVYRPASFIGGPLDGSRVPPLAVDRGSWPAFEDTDIRNMKTIEYKPLRIREDHTFYVFFYSGDFEKAEQIAVERLGYKKSSVVKAL